MKRKYNQKKKIRMRGSDLGITGRSITAKERTSNLVYNQFDKIMNVALTIL